MKTKTLALVTAFLSLVPLLVRGGSDFFLEIDGIEGESMDDVHQGAIEIASWSLGASNSTDAGGAGGGGGAGKVSFQDLHCTATVSKSSPTLMLFCANGKHIPKAILHVRKAGTREEYIQYVLEDVMVTSWSTSATETPSQSGSSGDVVPTDRFSLNFTSIKFAYTPAGEPPVVGTAVIVPPQ